jgi:NDP-sugar pyrophosphorylase family protein
MEKRAVILAGGKGTRLLPYTVTLPKPLVPVGDMPIMEIVIRQLVRAGFARITLACNHQAELIRAFFGDGSKWGVAIDYSLETTPLGTMGPLRHIRDLPPQFLVMNGDILTDLDFGELLESHRRDGDRLFTIAATNREQAIDFGVLEVDRSNTLTGFREKPTIPYLVSMGVYCLSRDVLAWVPDDRAFGFDELMLALLENERKVQIERYSGFWLDIGRPSDYQFAVERWEALKPRLLAT